MVTFKTIFLTFFFLLSTVNFSSDYKKTERINRNSQIFSSYNLNSTSFILSLFSNLEELKCKGDGAIDAFLLKSGYFESVGKRNGVKTYMLLPQYKDIIAINTYDNDELRYLLVSNKPDVYNYILKKGKDKGIETDSRGFTNLFFELNSETYKIRKESIDRNNMSYYIYTECSSAFLKAFSK